MILRNIIKPIIAIFASMFPFIPALSTQTVIHQEKSLYRNILVYEENGQRCLSFTRKRETARQTCQSLDDPNEFIFSYTRMMMGALYLNPNPRRILIVGLGGGILPSALSRIFPEAAIDIVEVDPAVVKVARDFFGFNPNKNIRVFEEDGRVFIKKAGKGTQRYDLVMLDAFDDQYIPEHLLTEEFLQEVKRVLTSDGVLAANTFSSSLLYDYESVTYHAVFGDFYNLHIKMKNRVILKKLDGFPSQEVLRNNADQLEDKLIPLGFGRDWLLPLFSKERDWNPNVRILTDQYSPSNLLNSLL